MTEKDYNALMQIAIKDAQEPVSREEALRSFVEAGIMDENGRLKPGYEGLAALLSSK